MDQFGFVMQAPDLVLGDLEEELKLTTSEFELEER